MKRAIICAMLVSGCQQDPMSDYPNSLATNPPVQSPAEKEKDATCETSTEAPPTEILMVYPPYGLKVPSIMEFVEGERGIYVFDIWIPEQHRALVTVSGLPDGAFYDPQDGKLIWTPGPNAANRAGNPSANERYYPIQVEMAIETDPMVAPLRRGAVLVVRDAPRNFRIKVEGKPLSEPLKEGTDFILTEGQEFTQIVTGESEDFPRGPFIFKLKGKDLPIKEISIEPADDHGSFILRWDPRYHEVTNKDQWDDVLKRYYKVRELEFEITNLRGQKINSPKITWKVLDAK